MPFGHAGFNNRVKQVQHTNIIVWNLTTKFLIYCSNLALFVVSFLHSWCCRERCNESWHVRCSEGSTNALLSSPSFSHSRSFFLPSFALSSCFHSKVAVDGWIDSPGHRKNLLSHMEWCAIGVYRNAKGAWYLTQ